MDTKGNPEADKALRQADDELSRLHAELTSHRAALMDRPSDAQLSVHELIGAWLELPEPPLRLDDGVASISLAQYNDLLVQLGELFKRAAHVGYPNNPWTPVVGISLADFLKFPMAGIRQSLNDAATCAKKADETANESIPDFAAQPSVIEQGEARQKLADTLDNAINHVAADVRAYWSKQDARAVNIACQKIADSQTMLDRLRSKRLDVELAVAARSNVPMIATIAQQVATLDAYLQTAKKWHAFMHLKQKKAASEILMHYGLTLSPDAADRLKVFLQELRERLILSQIYYDVSAQPPTLSLVPDDQLDRSMEDHTLVLDLLATIDSTPALTPLRKTVNQALVEAEHAQTLLDGLRKSPARAQAIADVQAAVISSQVLSKDALGRMERATLAGKHIGAAIQALAESVNSLEGVIRVAEGIATLPKGLKSAARQLIDIGADAEAALSALWKAVLAGEITRRLNAAPDLQTLDAHHIQEVFDRHRLLSRSKRTLVRDSILHRWTSRQRERLLALTRTRLNSLGAEVKRRFMLNGKKAMRLRKVIELGSKTEGGDPLFDLRPIWMASPETVAQIFPRQPIFDVVIFDEASQCRLEEALPVLIRAKRVVVAGDQKQLPPTRFFESAAVTSDEKEAETDQDLFEAQQGETEDLLSASLNMEIQESYLDVHYRSRNADLIEFSNQNFYGSRLQSIPGHPKNRTRFAPLTMDHVAGVYDKGANPVEADRVCQIVRDLLKRSSPPSIGIACFNVVQRDIILEKLDDLVANDSEFARRFAEARSRIGQGSFEGLFVKNLENVQGDERDHIIISTTYGPDAKGKFYRRFGPLGSAGGGRRLNVLVTRAREEVHLVTSIPRETYRSLPPIPAGTVPTGAWLLFSYLQFAENLAGAYEQVHRILEQSGAAETAVAEVRDPKTASPFAIPFGKRLANVQKIGNTVNWGNPGFCVDVALQHPKRAEDVTIGVLCDTSRFPNAEDPVEWDLFRTEIHESQGWTLQRVWTPHYFRDPIGTEERLSTAMMEFLAAEIPPDELPVTEV